MKSRREPLRSSENPEPKITTLEALLALQNNPEPQPSARPLRSAENPHSLSFPTFPTSDAITRRKHGSQSLPRKSENPDHLMEEINHLQHALVDKFRSNQKLVSGSQFRSGIKDPLKCEQCEAKDLLLKKTKENVRSLKFQIQRLEDRLYNGGGTSGGSGKKNHEKDLNLSGQSLEASSASTGGLIEELKKQISELEQMNATLWREKQQSDLTAGSALQLLREKDEIVVTLQSEIAELETTREEEEKKLGLLRSQLTLKIDYANDLEQKYQEACSALEELKALMEQNSRTQEEWDELQNEVSKLKRVIGENEISFRVIDRQNEDFRSNSLRLESEIRAKDGEISASQREVVKYRELLEIANRENTQLNDGMTKRELQRQASVSELDLLRSSLLEREQELQALQNEQNQRKVELESSVSRMNEMVKRLTGESEKSALAVQKAISSSVRLCVVAPTVNVHVADKKMKFRSSVPRESLSEFLEENILSKYTFLFEQKADSVAPDGVTDIQPWIKRILGEMQASIEDHISSAMRSNA